MKDPTYTVYFPEEIGLNDPQFINYILMLPCDFVCRLTCSDSKHWELCIYIGIIDAL